MAEICICGYCGEKVGKDKKYCRVCSTKAGRESVLQANVEALKDLRAHGYCKGEVLLMKP